MQAGADMLHVDDHLGTAAAAEFAGGCFCDYCMERFRTWLQNNYSAESLAALGITNPKTFNYKNYLYRHGITTKSDYLAKQNTLALNDAFLSFQYEAAVTWIQTMKTTAAAVAGKPIILGINAYNLNPTHLCNAHQAEYFANEVEHYDTEDIIPPFVYLQGTALHKPVFATAAGHDWIQVKNNKNITRVQWWIAQAYAFGHYFMYAYKKWGYSEQTGTVWYRTPQKTFKPIFSFISENKNLFDGYEPMANSGLLYGNEMGRRGNWASREIAQKLLTAGVQFSLIMGGDTYLQLPITNAHKKGFETIIKPASLYFDDGQEAILEHWENDGLVTVWDGVVPDEAWRITTNVDRLWTLARKHRTKKSIVIHLLNRDYDATTDQMNQKENVEIQIPTAMLDGHPTITLHAPGAKPQKLFSTETNETLSVTVPNVNIWAILQLE